MAAQQDIEFFSGNDLAFGCSFVNEQDGQPFDISGAQQLTYSLAKSAKSSTPLIIKTLGDGVTITNPTAGLAQVLVAADETEPLAGVYYHEIRLVNALGKKLTLMFGTVTINSNLIRN